MLLKCAQMSSGFVSLINKFLTGIREVREVKIVLQKTLSYLKF